MDLDHEDFAKRVKFAAGTIPAAGRFGDNKAFIHSVWAWGRFLKTDGLNLDAFKSHLVACNQKRLLDLSRADLVEAMDPSAVKLSHTAHQGATWNFVVINRPDHKES